MSLDTGLHLFQLERLGYVIRTASLKRLDLVFLSVKRAEKDRERRKAPGWLSTARTPRNHSFPAC